MKNISNIAASIFVVAVVVLSAISIFGVWDLIGEDAIWKSFKSIGLLAAVTLIVLIAEKFIDRASNKTIVDPATGQQVVVASEAAPYFKVIRHATLGVLILAVVLLAMLGIMSIWELLAQDVVSKSLTSISIVAFAAFVIVMMCLNREDHPLLEKHSSLSTASVIIIFLIIWFVTSLF